MANFTISKTSMKNLEIFDMSSRVNLVVLVHKMTVQNLLGKNEFWRTRTGNGLKN